MMIAIRGCLSLSLKRILCFDLNHDLFAESKRKLELLYIRKKGDSSHPDVSRPFFLFFRINRHRNASLFQGRRTVLKLSLPVPVFRDRVVRWWWPIIAKIPDYGLQKAVEQGILGHVVILIETLYSLFG